jgi:phage minor structural protein
MGKTDVVEDIKMIPTLFDKTATEYDTWGLGRIVDAQSAVVTEELGGEFTAEVVIPYSSRVYPELEVDRIIVLWVPYRRYHRTAPLTGNRTEGGEQPFRITSISKPMKGLVTVKCEHVSAQTKRIIMKRRGKWDGVHYNYQYFNDLPRAGDNPFSMDITEIKGDKVYIDNIVPAVKIPMSMRDYLQGKEGSITDVCRCDWIYNGWNITAVKKRGAEANVVIRYGVNLTDLKQDEEIAAVRTAMYPYWIKEENNVTTYVAPDTYVRCRYADNYPYDRIEIWDCSQEFDTQPTAQQLTDWAAAYMERNDWGVPNVSITINPVTQAGSLGYNARAMQTPEYEADQELYLGDEVKVIFEKLGIDTTARVTKYEFDSIKERYKKIDVGTIKPSITKSLAAVFKKTGVKIR